MAEIRIGVTGAAEHIWGPEGPPVRPPQPATYKIESSMQRGGMGELFLATRRNADGRAQKVVLKRLLPELMEDPSCRSMFWQEARIMSRLEHPNIVRVFDVPTIDAHPCLAMEYVEGRNLQQILKRCRALKLKVPPPIALHIILNVLRGLEYVHGYVMDGQPLELVHRDIAPANILVAFDGAIKITDFGIAKSRMSAVSTTVGVVKGTTRYLSPEQIRGQSVTSRSDLFSCAVVLAELLTGESLFDRGSVPPTLFAIVSGDRPEIATILPFHAPVLAEALEKALYVHPQHRYPSARAFAEALEAASLALGSTVGSTEVGAYLKELFAELQLEGFAQSESDEELSGVDALYLTYLLDAPDSKNDPKKRQSEHNETFEVARQALQHSTAGARPLDGAEFDAKPSERQSAQHTSDRDVARVPFGFTHERQGAVVSRLTISRLEETADIQPTFVPLEPAGFSFDEANAENLAHDNDRAPANDQIFAHDDQARTQDLTRKIDVKQLRREWAALFVGVVLGFTLAYGWQWFAEMFV